ncbi:T9SS type A sorting domain-containing protein [Hymenobacter sp.]|uniref:T9SS type A sorting domain-containing protein n=1 Tax=Hymenobacter sp. TaxID=1898978 RepID=UPI002EDA0681
MVKSLPFIGAALMLTISTRAQSLTEVLQAGKWPTTTTSLSAPTASRLVVSQLQQALVQNAANNGTSWTDYSRDVYSRYSGMYADLPGTIRYDRWSGSAWTPVQATRRRYTTTGKLLSDTVISYQSGVAGQAILAKAIAYNAADQVAEEKTFANLNSAWEELQRNTHTYGTNNLVAQVLEEVSLSGSYETTGRRIFTYNAQGQRVEYEVQASDGSGGWEKVQKVTYGYSTNATGAVEQAVIQIASTDGTTYLNSNRQTLQYDSQGKATTLTTEAWDNNAWQNYLQATYTYDALDNPSILTLQTWSGTSYRNEQRLILTYAQVASNRSAGKLNAALTVAPNPAAAAATVRYELPTAGQATVEVVDLMGRQVALVAPKAIQAAGTHTVQLPVSTLAAGLYVVRLQMGNQTQQTKLEVQ